MQARNILTASCDRISASASASASGQWGRCVGNGRLNVHVALRLASRWAVTLIV